MTEKYINLDIDKAEEWFFALLGKHIEVTNLINAWDNTYDILTGIEFSSFPLKSFRFKYVNAGYARIKKSDYDNCSRTAGV